MKRTKRMVAVALSAALVTSVGLAGNASAEDASRRWDLAEKSYADMNMLEKGASNARRGFVGLIDSVGQGAFSAFAVGRGLLIRKAATFSGDVIGLVDDNMVTKHVTQGVISRHLLRFGAGAKGTASFVGVIHDRTFQGPGTMLDDYVGDTAFHTKAYVAPSILATLGAVVVSDFVVRPLGSLITIVGARETGDSMHDWGIGLIEDSLSVEFL